jgi:hypothetical protein
MPGTTSTTAAKSPAAFTAGPPVRLPRRGSPRNMQHPANSSKER